MEQHYTQEDLDWVKKLLGRSPRGLHKVIKYHPREKHPMVIQVIPWVQKAPFPTMFWLTCPLLKKQLSHLEKDRFIKDIEHKYFPENPKLLQGLREDHAQYRDERIELFNETIASWEQLPLAQQEILKETGIGGIADFDHVKCLHLHYAHHLAKLELGGTTIGRLIDAIHPHIRTCY